MVIHVWALSDINVFYPGVYQMTITTSRKSLSGPNVSNEMTMQIYPGSSVTVFGAYCLLMEFKRLCKIPFSTMFVLLNLLQLLCPVGNLLPTIKYQLVKFARQSTSLHSTIDFCRSCGTELQRNRRCHSRSCPKTEPNSMILISPDQTISTHHFRYITFPKSFQTE